MRIIKGLAISSIIIITVYLAFSNSLFTGEHDKADKIALRDDAKSIRSDSNQTLDKNNDEMLSGQSINHSNNQSGLEQLAEDTKHHHSAGSEISQAAINKTFWHEPLSLQSSEYFPNTQTELELADSCQSKPAFTQVDTLEQLIEEQYQVDTARRHPDNVFFKAITQFIQSGSEYIQITLIWERDLPASYRYELFTSTDPRFESDVQKIAPPVAEPTLKDVLASYDFLERVIEHYQNNGAVLGAQIFEGEMNAENLPVSMTLVNGKPTFFSSQASTCQSEYQNNTAFCQCSGA